MKRKNYLRIKRIQDIVFSFVLLIFFSPFLILISLLIVLDSPGCSPIFSQTRIGKDGKPFTFYKLRTMRPSSERERAELQKFNEMDGPVFKIKEDPRITRLGKFLRRSGLDELPQLWNVLRGEMSLVGPRPALPEEVKNYDEATRERLKLLPGITGYWQIQPNRNSLSFREWMRMDQLYIREQSLLTDWRIMFATLGAMLGMNGE